MNPIIQQWLKTYKVITQQDQDNALKEIIQKIALCGLWRAKFFEKAAFYGGTALRIFYGLDRFSEDLDFSLLQPDPSIQLTPYYHAIKKECELYGFDVVITEKKKQEKTPIQSAFLKTNTILNDLIITSDSHKQLKIKLEIDTLPPNLFETETQYLLQPIEFFVKTYTIPNLFAGKMHAILCRSWKTRVKGRDWYDLIFYIKNHYSLNLLHLHSRLYQSSHLDIATPLTPEKLKTLLHEKIDTVDFEQAKIDIQRFIKDPSRLDVWGKSFFNSLVDHIIMNV
jgi:predicted nucleotidyltransferase component of viral defense system